MRLSKLFTKTRKDAPKDELSKSARLLIRAGFIYKDSAGVYAMLPLGLKVLGRLEGIIRVEMEALGGVEISMTSLQRQELWQRTDRWDDNKVDIWFKSKLKNDTEVGLAWSHEEPITEMMTSYIESYRDLPAYPYQFQTKLRNETRAKSGIMRTREFVMKDLYSYSRSEGEHQKFYDKVTAAYLRIFEAAGIGDRTFLTFASGGPFADFSHEFQTVTEAGEDTIYLDRDKKLAVNEEVMRPEVLERLGLKKADLVEEKAAEVGNIFSFGTTKSEQLGLSFTDEDGKDKLVVLGSYGIGVPRLMGVIAECLSDDKGLVWPASVAPADVHIVVIGEDAKVVKTADQLYDDLQAADKEVIYDDRDASAGQKFADADLMGVPLRLTVSSKTLEHDSVEVKKRSESNSKLIKLEQILKSV